MITGDKQETAINIAIACKLIRRPDSLLICNASSQEDAHARLQQLKQQLSRTYAPVGGPPKPTPFSGAPAPRMCPSVKTSEGSRRAHRIPVQSDYTAAGRARLAEQDYGVPQSPSG